jgi:hypothetical protein
MRFLEKVTPLGVRGTWLCQSSEDRGDSENLQEDQFDSQLSAA